MTRSRIAELKEYLNQGFGIEREIKVLKMEYDAVYASTFKIPQLKDVVVQESHAGKPDDKYADLVEYIQMLEKRQADLVHIKYKLSRQIDRIEDERYRSLLRLRYILCFKWEDVAKHLGYEDRYTRRVHGQALIEFLKANPSFDESKSPDD